MLGRRGALAGALVGAGYLGARALATGLPVGLLLDPRRALAASPPAPPAAARPSYVVFLTSYLGDPMNASAPGSYVHGAVNTPGGTTKLNLGDRVYEAGSAWAQLDAATLARTSFWHIMTNTPVHPKEGDVLKLMDATAEGEMLPSILAKHLAPLLGTIQPEPVCLDAMAPAETISFDGGPLAMIPPLALKDTLTNPTGPLTVPLQRLRDQTLDALYGLYKEEASPAQRQFIDSLVTSQRQVRSIEQSLLGSLAAIVDNDAPSQMHAAVTLIQMKLAPVISVHIPFGGDNHSDPGLATEQAQTKSGVAAIATLMGLLRAAGLWDDVCFMSLNVFGRTLASASSADGRQHNGNHQVSIAIGRPFASKVIGGIAPVAGDFGCMGVDPATGAGMLDMARPPIAPVDTLTSFGKTMLAAVGASPGYIGQQIKGGQVVRAALV